MSKIHRLDGRVCRRSFNCSYSTSWRTRTSGWFRESGSQALRPCRLGSFSSPILTAFNGFSTASAFRNVSKTMRELCRSSSPLQSKLFRLDRPDRVALLKLVGLPEEAAAAEAKSERIARRQARVKRQVELNQKGTKAAPASSHVETNEDADSGVDSDASWGDMQAAYHASTVDLIKIHPLLQGLTVVRKAGTTTLRLRKPHLRIEDLVAKGENATHPPMSRITIVACWNDVSYELRGDSQSGTPMAVEDVFLGLQQGLRILSTRARNFSYFLTGGLWVSHVNVKGVVSLHFDLVTNPLDSEEGDWTDEEDEDEDEEEEEEESEEEE